MSSSTKGKAKGGTEAWPSDRLQTLAYALLLAEHRGEPIPEVEREVSTAVSRAKELRASLQRPPVTASEKLCRTCSLAPVCLPEEERFAEGADESPQRLFPPDDSRRIVHIVEQGASVSKDGEQLVVWIPDGTKKPLPGLTVSALILHGNVQISTQAIHFCAANGVGVHWLSYGGHYVGAVTPGAGGVQRRARQFRALEDHGLRVRLSARIAQAKVENMIRYLLKGRGERLQLSVFRVQMTRVQIEELRWKLSKVLEEEDSLMILRLCAGCAQRVIDTGGDDKWKNPPPAFEVL